jgi:predicted XRE-type DNA-binding protein
MNPYNINLKKLKVSKEVTDERGILKRQLAKKLNELISDMSRSKITKKTGLHKSDISRLKIHNVDRFSIDRMVSILDALGYVMTFKIKNKKAC